MAVVKLSYYFDYSFYLSDAILEPLSYSLLSDVIPIESLTLPSALAGVCR